MLTEMNLRQNAETPFIIPCTVLRCQTICLCEKYCFSHKHVEVFIPLSTGNVLIGNSLQRFQRSFRHLPNSDKQRFCWIHWFSI